MLALAAGWQREALGMAATASSVTNGDMEIFCLADLGETKGRLLVKSVPSQAAESRFLTLLDMGVNDTFGVVVIGCGRWSATSVSLALAGGSDRGDTLGVVSAGAD